MPGLQQRCACAWTLEWAVWWRITLDGELLGRAPASWDVDSAPCDGVKPAPAQQPCAASGTHAGLQRAGHPRVGHLSCEGTPSPCAHTNRPAGTLKPSPCTRTLGPGRRGVSARGKGTPVAAQSNKHCQPSCPACGALQGAAGAQPHGCGGLEPGRQPAGLHAAAAGGEPCPSQLRWPAGSLHLPPPGRPHAGPPGDPEPWWAPGAQCGPLHACACLRQHAGAALWVAQIRKGCVKTNACACVASEGCAALHWCLAWCLAVDCGQAFHAQGTMAGQCADFILSSCCV